MASVTALGTGSGLQLEDLLTKLMTAESAPLTALQTKQNSYSAKISALGTLQSKLAALQTAATALTADIGQTALSKFASYSASSSDTTVATATATTGAVAATYDIQVTQLAQGKRFTSGAFASTSTAIGTNGQTLTFNFGPSGSPDASRQKTITLDSGNNSLVGLRNSINNASMGVTASIVTGKDGNSQLIFSEAGGAANEVSLSGTLSMPFTTTGTAQDAEFTVNGIAASSSTNTSSTAVNGMTFNLAKIGTTTVSVTSDYSANITTALNSFITAYNNANSTMTTMGAYNSTTKVAGALQGNDVLRNAQTQTRSLLFSTTTGGTSNYQHLSDLGVSVGTDGSLSLDSTKLSKALAADPNAAATLVGKIGTAFNTSLEKVVGTSGTIKIATDGANTMVKEMVKRQDTLQSRLTNIEKRYRAQFTALDTLVSKFNSTATYLTQQLANLTSSSSK